MLKPTWRKTLTTLVISGVFYFLTISSIDWACPTKEIPDCSVPYKMEYLWGWWIFILIFIPTYYIACLIQSYWINKKNK